MNYPVIYKRINEKVKQIKISIKAYKQQKHQLYLLYIQLMYIIIIIVINRQMCKFELKSIEKYYNISIYVNIINERSDNFKNSMSQSCCLDVLHVDLKVIQNISDIIVEYYNYSIILEKMYINECIYYLVIK